MALDNFRTIELIWDKANKSIIKTIKTASSDTTGRYLSVKILDGGQEVTLNNAKLQLYWEHPNFNTSGTDDFNTVNNGGLFKMTFSDEMLTNIGELNAHLVLTLADGTITSDGFLIEVFKGADDGVVVPTNGSGLVEQIDGKIDKGNVTLNDLTQEVKLAMTGGAVPVVGEKSVNTLNIVDKAVTPEKLSFTKLGKNLFDKTKATAGAYISNTTGLPVTSEGFYYSDYIPVKPNTAYVKKGTYRYALYDSDLNFISGGNQVKTFTTTSNTAYVIISTNAVDQNGVPGIDKEQLEEGTESTPYEPYKQLISGIEIDPETFKKHLDNVEMEVNPSQIVGYVSAQKNLFDKTKATAGGYINHTTGQFVASEGFCYSDYIPVKSNTNYVKKGTYRYALFDANKDFISGGNQVNTFKTTPTTAYVVITTYEIDYGGVIGIDGEQLEEGTESTAYEPYKPNAFTIQGLELPSSSSAGETGSELDFVLPPKIYGVIGKELNVYFDNVASQKMNNYDIDVTSTMGKQMAKRWTATPETAGTSKFKLDVYQNARMLVSKEVDLVINNINTSNKKVLVMGDSTVEQQLGVKRLYTLYQEEDSLLDLVGTQTTGVVNHEGRGGWTLDLYRKNTYPNPFYNPTKQDFDLGYYMSSNGFSGLDVFIIVLGINDTFGTTDDNVLNTRINAMIADYNAIISSIHEYDPNIKVGVTVTIPPSSSQDIFGDTRGVGQTQWRYKRNNFIWNHKAIDNFKNKESQNIYLVPLNHNLDTDNNLADHVHPTESGYNQMGDSLYYFMKSLS